MREISYLALGGTLFIPASHKNLEAIVSAKKYESLRSLVIDFEDGLEESVLSEAMQRLSGVLACVSSSSPFIFLRAKSVEHLAELLRMEKIERVDGFVLAKFSLSNADKYLQLLRDKAFYILPSIEGEELFHHEKLHQLKEKILSVKEQVVVVRFGLEDMLRQLSMRRECGESIFDFTSTSSVIGNFIATFKSAGFGVSGGVYPCFGDSEGFEGDVKRDLKEGLFSKTIIHPSQIEVLNELYKVTQLEYEEAKEITDSKQKLFAQNSKMAEKPTMLAHSQMILHRARLYGVERVKY